MKRTLKKALSVLLAVTMVFGTVAFGLADVDWSEFVIEAIAGGAEPTDEQLISENGYSGILWYDHVEFLSCENGIKELVIPSTINGFPVTSICDGALAGNEEIISAIVPASVTYIGSCVFKDCVNLQTISLSKNIIFIGHDFLNNSGYYNEEKNWENGCLYIEEYLIDSVEAELSSEINIKDGTLVISESSFKGSNILTSVEFPNTLKRINRSAFSNCLNLVNLKFSETEIILDEKAFYSCSSIEHVTIYANEISLRVFEGCEGLKSVELLGGLEKISSHAFSDCIQLNGVSMPNTVTYIGQYVFSGCENLRNVRLSEGLSEINEGLFRDCKSLTNITIPDSVYSIRKNVFLNCTNLKEIEFGENSKITEISQEMFKGFVALERITLPGNLITIGKEAFSTCISLKEIIIPDTVTRIGDKAFYGCLNLQKITIGDNVEALGLSAFHETGLMLNADNWVDGVLYIGNYLIEAQNTIEGEYTVNYGTRMIYDFAFQSCQNLTKVNLPDTLIYIGGSAFANCSKLQSITIPSSVKNIFSRTFYQCSNLNDIDIQNGIENIEAYSFSGIGISEIFIPESVITIGENAFFSTSKLKSFNVDEKNNNYCSNDGVLFNKDKTLLIQYPRAKDGTAYSIPSGVTEILTSAFYNCKQLTDIDIPEGVKTIGDNAFYNNGFSRIVLPSSLESIGARTFEYCSLLAELNLPSQVREIGNYAFENCSSLEKVSVDSDNECFIAENNVLFNYDKTTLIMSPCKNESINKYYLPDTVKLVMPYAFYDSKNLTEMIISTNSQLEEIGEHAFEACRNLKIIGVLPQTLKRIGNESFRYCLSLEFIEVDEENEFYCNDRFGVLFDKAKTSLKYFPVGCNLKNYTIPDGVQVIGTYSFWNTCLDSITIPQSVNSIQGSALSGGLIVVGGYIYDIESRPNPLIIYYHGSSSDWNEIRIANNNKLLSSATIVYSEQDTVDGSVTIPISETVEDESTDISIDYISNFHEGEVGISVERTLDEKAFDVITTDINVTENIIYDIKMTIDGVETQPNGKVTVRIPLPDGYDPAKTFVYHVDTNLGRVENMNAEIEKIEGKDYLVFVTDHFSYYAVVEEKFFTLTWSIDGVETKVGHKEGDTIEKPEDPVKDGYTFVGWDAEIPEKMPASNLTFTAKFEKIPEESTTDPTVPSTKPTETTTPPTTKPSEIPTTKPVEPTTQPTTKPAEPTTAPTTKPAETTTKPTEPSTTKPVVTVSVPSVEIRRPSQTEIKYGDSIVLHADTKNLPEGAYIEWTADNGNFKFVSYSTDRINCTVTPVASGDTVFTATVYDADGNEICSDTQTMTAKAGFFQKIIAFFKKLFGLTKVIPEMFKN